MARFTYAAIEKGALFRGIQEAHKAALLIHLNLIQLILLREFRAENKLEGNACEWDQAFIPCAGSGVQW